MTDFAHLHLHTEYSLLDGMGRIKQYIDRAAELGQKHMAVTDHGVMYGAMDWYKAATTAGMHPIIGMEAYLSEGKASAPERKNYHLLLLAENEKGYRNLLQLASRAALEGFYYRPRVDLEMLGDFSEGLIGTSACLGGPVANNFLYDQPDRAYTYAKSLSDIFGKDRFYIELQDHGLPEQLKTNRDMIELSKKLSLPLVVTNDVHYCNQEDASAQDLLICVGTNTTIHDEKRLKQDTDQFFLKSGDDMARLFAEHPEAISNTVRIAEMCNLDLGFKGYQLPHFDTPNGESTEQYLRTLCTRGALERYGTIEGEVGQRLDYELGIIQSMGFTNYFLIVWDFVNFAKNQGILVGPGRGSAAGSIVTYTLNITGLDPLEHNLIFERFLNPSRISMPDIDIDFADDRRSEVIDYVVHKYGDDRVAQIATFGTLKAKQAVKDVGRAMGLTIPETNRVANLIPADPKMTIDLAMQQVPELHKLYDAEQSVRELVDNSRRVEGLARHPGKHAAGVVISRDPLVQHVPLQKAGKGRSDVTTQWTQGHLEDLGLLKMDFLGLKTLTVLRHAVDNARMSGADITIDTIPMNDEAAFALLQRGETFGVFQLEGGMTTRMTVDVHPESFEDMVALMALIRPGPMEFAPDYIARKHGRAPVQYPHPALEEILSETWGVALYQEQVMRIANVLAGFSMADADGLRKGMGKKLPEVVAKYKDQFLKGAVDNDVPKETAQAVWEVMERFAGYGFPKAHSAAYAVIGMQTAYMKAHYPAEFMAGLMSTEMDSAEKTASTVNECQRARIKVLPPSINDSRTMFSVEKLGNGESAVRFGLGAIKGVGSTAIESVVQARLELSDQRFESLDAFCDAVDWSTTNKRMLESLIKAGAFDEFGHRAQVMVAIESLAAASQKRQRAAARGQMDLFGSLGADQAMPEMSTVLPDVTPAEQRETLAWEKEALGLYISSHPLKAIVGEGVPFGYVTIGEFAEISANQSVKFIGMVKSARRVTTRRNQTMAILEVEDLTGTTEVVLFPSTYEQFHDMIGVESILSFDGKVEEQNERRQVILNRVSADLPQIQRVLTSDERVSIGLEFSGDYWRDVNVLHQLDEVLKEHEGETPIRLIVGAGQVRPIFRSRTRRVEWTRELEASVRRIDGVGDLWFESTALDDVDVEG